MSKKDNSNDLIVQAKRDYYKQYRDKNKDKLNEYQRKWRAENKDKDKEYKHNYWLKKAVNQLLEN